MPLRSSIAADKEAAIVGGGSYTAPPASRRRRLATARLELRGSWPRSPWW